MLWEPIAAALLEDSDSLLYVTRTDNNQLIYMNKQAKFQLGLPEDDDAYEGQLCHKLIHGSDTPCKDCKRHMLNHQDFYRWKHYDPVEEMHYWVKEKLITVGGVDCHMQLALHMNEHLENERKVRRELEKERVLIRCVRTLETTLNINDALNNLLQIVTQYFNGDRAYLFEFDYEKQVTNNTYEYATEEVEKAIDDLQDVPLSVIQSWIVAFSEHGSFYISDLDENVDRTSDTYRILEMQGIRSLIAVPLEQDGQIIGFFGVDNPRQNYEDISLLSSITFFILNGLEKRTVLAQLEKLSYEDTLTGLLNRNKFNHVVEAMTRRPPKQLGVVYMDLNNLKRTNDTLGHEAGDRLIQTAARIIRQTFGRDTYRIGGDEFVAFVTDGDEAALQAKLTQMDVDMAAENANVSVGYSYCSGDVNPEQQLSIADKAMYAEKLIYRSKQNKT